MAQSGAQVNLGTVIYGAKTEHHVVNLLSSNGNVTVASAPHTRLITQRQAAQRQAAP